MNASGGFFLRRTVLLLALGSLAAAEPYQRVTSPLLREEMAQLAAMSHTRRIETLRRLSPEKKRQYADAMRDFDPALDYNDIKHAIVRDSMVNAKGRACSPSEWMAGHFLQMRSVSNR